MFQFRSTIDPLLLHINFMSILDQSRSKYIQENFFFQIRLNIIPDFFVNFSVSLGYV